MQFIVSVVVTPSQNSRASSLPYQKSVTKLFDDCYLLIPEVNVTSRLRLDVYKMLMNVPPPFAVITMPASGGGPWPFVHNKRLHLITIPFGLISFVA